jgi:hypothetical protein
VAQGDITLSDAVALYESMDGAEAGHYEEWRKIAADNKGAAWTIAGIKVPVRNDAQGLWVRKAVLDKAMGEHERLHAASQPLPKTTFV